MSFDSERAIRIVWDYAWTAREALYGYRYFLLQGGQFLRQTKNCRRGFVCYDEAEQFVRQRELRSPQRCSVPGCTAPAIIWISRSAADAMPYCAEHDSSNRPAEGGVRR